MGLRFGLAGVLALVAGVVFAAPATAAADPLVTWNEGALWTEHPTLVRRVAANNARRLRPGDVVEASIGTDDASIDFGTQRNEVIEARHGAAGTTGKLRWTGSRRGAAPDRRRTAVPTPHR